jgi:hypothetical protein
MEEELLNLIGEYLVKQVKELILTPKPRFTKRGSMTKPSSPYNFNASGRLYNSVSYVLRDGEIDILMEDYGVDFVFGEGSFPGGGAYYPDIRAKGSKGGTSKLITELEKWVKAKIGLQGAKAKGMAFAVRKNLFKAGYKGYNLFTNEFQEDTGKYVSQLLEDPKYQELALGDIFDRINIFGNQQYNIAIG